MNPTGVIGAFQRLPTSDSRFTALTALLGELTPYEWRQLHALLGARSFCFDIIAHLPIELVANVFSYLDVSTPYRLQRVSKQWNRRLQSPDVLKPTLSAWYDGRRDLQRADYAFCKAEAQRVHAFRTGKPKSCIKFVLQHPIKASVLVGETFIWQSATDVSRVVFLLNLKTWNLRTVGAEARLAISSFCASDQLLVLSTLDAFHVFTLHDLKQKKFRTPSHAFREAMSCRGRNVACAANFADYMEVYIWNYDTQRGKSFQVRRDPSHNFFALGVGFRHRVTLLLHPDNDTILILGEVHRSEEAPSPYSYITMMDQILIGRFNSDGKCVSHSCMLPTSGLRPVALKSAPSDFIPVDHKGLFAVRVRGLGQGPERDFVFQFDENIDQFVAFSNPNRNHRLWMEGSMAWWKDTCYGSKFSNGRSHRHWGHCGNSVASKFKPLVSPHEDSRFYHGLPKCTVMNERYVVYALSRQVNVLSFESNNMQPTTVGPILNVEIIKDFENLISEEEELRPDYNR